MMTRRLQRLEPLDPEAVHDGSLSEWTAGGHPVVGDD